MLGFKSFAGFGKEKHSLIESISTASAPFTRAFVTRKFLDQVRGFEILASIVKLVTHSGFSKVEIFSVSNVMNISPGNFVLFVKTISSRGLNSFCLRVSCCIVASLFPEV